MAEDDRDPDGLGEPGDMRYDYARTQQRTESERRIRARRQDDARVPPMPYFGEPWPSAVCDEGQRWATPVGDLCLQCDEAIEEQHQGSYMYDVGGGLAPVHRECALRAVLGGIAHMRRTCSCYAAPGFADDPDAGLSYRESALLVWAYVQEHGTGYPSEAPP